MDNVQKQLYYGKKVIDDFVEQCFAGNYQLVSKDIEEVISSVNSMSNIVAGLMEEGSEESQILNLILNHIVASLENKDIYRLCDSLLQVSDFLEIYRKIMV